MAKRGRFIVIDGTDGSGKATQTNLIVERLKREGRKTKKIDFPRYYDNFFGAFIGECLSGQHGDFLAIDPHIASTLYAADRFESKKVIEGWLSKGFTVISDRYVSANQIHQGGKILNDKKRALFLKWLDRMEYGVFKIPKPDAVIYLSLPVKLTQTLLKAKAQGLSHKKRYLRGAKDAAETDTKHLERARHSATNIVKRGNNWFKVDCEYRGKVRTREDIHQDVYSVVRKILKR